MTGTFVLSLDTELAWGTMDREGFRTYRGHLERTRQNIESLLTLLGRYDIPATWAFVGHLLLDSCHREATGADPHPDVLTARFPWFDYEWHHHDPGSDRQSDPFWYGDHILELVREARPEHEVGWYRNLPGPMARAGHFAHRLFGIAPPVYKDLEVTSGVVNIPASMFLMPPDGIRAMIPGRSRTRQAILGLRNSARTGAVFHLWFYPWNKGTSGAMLDWLDTIFGKVDRLRAEGSMRVMTMASLAKEVLGGTE